MAHFSGFSCEDLELRPRWTGHAHSSIAPAIVTHQNVYTPFQEETYLERDGMDFTSNAEDDAEARALFAKFCQTPPSDGNDTPS